MARTAGDTVDFILNRLRQVDDTADSQDRAITLLSHCQKLINEHSQEYIGSSALSTTANTLIYSYRSSIATARDIISIREGNRELRKVESFNEFSAYDSDWFTQTGTRFEAWMQLGRDLLILYPSKTGASSVTVTYSKRTGTYDDYIQDASTNMDISDENVELALNLTEILLLIRYKNFEEASLKIDKLKEEFEERLTLYG